MLTRRLVPSLFALAATSCGGMVDAPPGDPVADPVPFEPSKTKFEIQVGTLGSERHVLGYFSRATSDAPRSGCPTESVDGCRIKTCETTGGSAPTDVTYHDPGVVTASSPSLGTVVLLNEGQGLLRITQEGDFAPGEEVRVVGVGSDTFAPFDLTAVVPSPFVLSSIGNCTKGSLDAPCALASGDAIVDWTGGAGGQLSVTFAAFEEQSVGRIQMSCWFPDSARRARVPAAALARLPRAHRYHVSVELWSKRDVSAPGSGLTLGLFATRTQTMTRFALPALTVVTLPPS